MHPAARPVDRWDGALAAVLALAALAVRVAAAREYQIDVVTGPDSPLWGLSALDWQVGNKLHVPPLFPALAGLAGWAGLGVADGGRLVSLVAGSAATAGVYAGARALGLSRLAALLGSALVVMHPDLVAESLIFQPEAVTAAVLGAVAAAALVHALRRSIPSFVAYALAVGLAATAREHGLALLLPSLLFAALFPPRSPWARAWAPLALFALVSLTPVLGRSSPLVWPTEWPWADKAAVVQRDLVAIKDGFQPAYLNMNVDSYPAGDTVESQAVSDAYSCAILLPAEQRSRAILGLHWRRARALGHDLHAWRVAGLGGATLLAWRRRNWAMAAALPSLLVVIVPAFVVWSQRRHAVVLMPAAFLGVAAGADSLSAWVPPRARGVVLATLGAGALGFLAWSGRPTLEGALEHLAGLAADRRETAAFGRAIHQGTPQWTEVAGIGPDQVVHEGGMVLLYAERAPIASQASDVQARPDVQSRLVQVVSAAREVPGMTLIAEGAGRRAYAPEGVGPPPGVRPRFVVPPDLSSAASLMRPRCTQGG